MKKTLPTLGLAVSAFLLPLVVSAQTLTTPVEGHMVSDSMKAHVEARMETRKETKEIKKIEHALTGKVTAINGTSLTVLAKKGTYTVDVSQAKFVRRFGAVMTLGDVQVNDELTINGTVSSSTSTMVTAKVVRDLSLQARNGSFEGTVSNITANSFTLSTKNRKDQTINLTASTTFMNDGKVSTAAALMNGSRVVVSGVWDRTNSDVTAKKVRIVIATKQVAGTISALSGNILTVTGKTPTTTFSVDVTGAKVLRLHGSVGTIAELKVGDKVEIHGKQATTSSNILASWIRDLSITASTTTTHQE